MINGGQYRFSCDKVSYMGVIKFPVIAEGYVDVLLVDCVTVDGNSLVSPVLFEVEHVRVIKESQSFLQKDIIIEHNIYIVHSSYFIDHKLPYRQGIDFVYCIDDERFCAYDYVQKDLFAYVNSEHQYLQSRIAIVEAINQGIVKSKAKDRIASCQLVPFQLDHFERLRNSVADNILFSTDISSDESYRTSRVFSELGIRHDLIPRHTSSIQISSIFLMQTILGDFFSFAHIGSKTVYIGRNIESLNYGGMPPLDCHLVFTYDYTQMGLKVKWRNHRGDYNSIIQPIAEVRLNTSKFIALFEKKWFRIDRTTDLVESSYTVGNTYEYFWVVKIEINSSQFDPVTYINKKKKNNLDYRFTSVLIAWCLSLATISKLKLSHPFTLTQEEISRLCDYFHPEDMSPDWLIDVAEGDIPRFYSLQLKPEHDAVILSTPSKSSKKFKAEREISKKFIEPYIGSSTKKRLAVDTTEPLVKAAIESLLSDNATARELHSNTVWLLKELRLTTTKAGLILTMDQLPGMQLSLAKDIFPDFGDDIVDNNGMSIDIIEKLWLRLSVHQ